MTGEMYLDGKRVDTEGGITLKFVSNVLGDISKIESNRSYTVTLPRTVNNDTVLGWAALPTVDADTPRRYMSVDYIVDGTAVIAGGRAYITKATSEGYEVCLVWGECPALVRMKNDNRKLTALTSRDHWFTYTKTPAMDTVAHFLGQDAYGFADYNSNVPGDVLPVVTVLYILNAIAEQYGVTFNIPADRLTAMGRWLVALTTRKMTVDDQPVSIDTGAATTGGVVDQTWQNTGYNTIYFHNFSGALRLVCSNAYHVRTWRLRVSTASQAFIVRLTHADGTVDTYYSSNISTGQAVDVIRSDFDMVRERITVTATALNGTLAEQVDYSLTATIDAQDEVQVGEGYRITPNLPDMTCIDFIKEVCSRLGLHAMRNGSNTEIDLLPVETILARADQPIALLSVNEVSFALDGWAQRNALRYTTDDHSDGDHAGYITVDNDTIEKTADMFTSKFISGNGSYIPLYTLEERDDGNGNTETTVKTNRLKPRFGRLYSTVGTDTARFTFNGTGYSVFVADWWAGMSSLLDKAVQVRGDVLLHPWQAAALDMARPVYDSTTNSRYLIVEASGDENDIYTFTLIKA